MEAQYNIIEFDTKEPYINDPSVGVYENVLCEAIKSLSLQKYSENVKSLAKRDADIMEWLGNLFGFQDDNVRNQRENLVLLLANHMLQRQAPDITNVKVKLMRATHETTAGAIDGTTAGATTMATVTESVNFLHDKLLENYKSWCAFVHQNDRLSDGLELPHICLYLLTWGEASNLRFMPECLCYIFYHLIGELNATISPTPMNSPAANDDILTSLASSNDRLIDKVKDSPHPFLEFVITPIYSAVSKEALATKNGATPHSAWRNYDDMNEFFWSKDCFEQLGWLPDDLKSRSDYLTDVPMDAGAKLEPETTSESIAVANRGGDDGSAVQNPHYIQHGEHGAGGLHHRFTHKLHHATRSLSSKFSERLSESIIHHRRNKQSISRPRRRFKMGFKVGFVEQRSFWNIFHSFPRLWIAQFLVLHFLIILAFLDHEVVAPAATLRKLLSDEDNRFRLLYLLITWSALLTVQAFLTIVLQFSLLSSRRWLLALRMAMKLVAATGWTAAFSLLLARVEDQRGRDNVGASATGAWSTESERRLRHLLITTVVFLLPEAVALILFFLPKVANHIEQSQAKLIWLLSWWFSTRTYVGRGMHQDLPSTLKYAGFWVALFATKISFSYYFQIQPLVAPTHAILSLKNVEYQWFVFFGTAHRFEVLLLWAPVLLMYLMDVQIWYAIFSSFYGVGLGLFSHIGAIRNMHQLRHCFPEVATATANVLLHREASSPNPHLPPGFTTVWNRIIEHLRKEDLLSNHEKEHLHMPEWPPLADTMAPRWPSLFLVDEVAKVVMVTQTWKGKRDQDLWKTVSKKGRAAVAEILQSVKFILTELAVGINELISDDNGMMDKASRMLRIVNDIERCMTTQRNFLETYKIEEVKTINLLVAQLLRSLLLDHPPDIKHRHGHDHDLKDLILAAQVKIPFVDLLEALELDFRKSPLAIDTSTHYSGTRALTSTVDWKQLVLRTYNMIIEQEDAASLPKNLEARRRLAFFSNSVFMRMPKAMPVASTPAFSVLIPHYAEDVAYHDSKLETENEDGITIMYYLKKIFPDEWDNFEERKMAGKRSAIWATLRGQTLRRTVRGMMYYMEALKLLHHLDHVHHHEQLLPQTASNIDSLELQDIFAARLKFTLVVASQKYGELKRNNDVIARDIGELLKKYSEVLRVAYVDVKSSGRNGDTVYDAVLVKYDKQSEREVEVYRIRLPGNFLLGEGKPENQNQAIIFTRGEALQAIDMNQENYFEEALKMRNLLQEFGEGGSSGGRVVERRRRKQKQKRRILGIREHVFTGSVSSLAFFMSAQESSFVTLGQRVLSEPLRIRMHYGHPDVFDRLWFVTRGGISKASKSINISEDIYAGFNCTLRGGSVSHHEYIQVGKGRDVGINQIATFEGKIAGGNGEQTLSRDVYRLGHSLDFARMVSFYYTSIGFYADNLLLVLAAYAYMWSRVYMGLSGVEHAIAAATADANAFIAALNQQFLVQLGIFTSLPLLLENWLEHGFSNAAWNFLLMQLQLCSIFYTFSLGTKAHFYGRTLLHGGARYKGTGRDFVVRRQSFAQNYRLHSRSHFVKGLELLILLLIYTKYSEVGQHTVTYVITMLTFWFLALSWIMAPFVFNPSGFDWLQTVYDYENFLAWLWQGKGGARRAEESWEVWWNEQQEHLNSTGPWGRLAEVVISSRFFLIQYGMVYRLKIASHNKSILVYLLSWTYVVVAVVVYMVVARAADKYAADNHIFYRSMQMFVILFIALVITLLALLTDFQLEDLFVSMLAFLPTGWGLLCMAAVGKPWLGEDSAAWSVVVQVARLYDLAIAHIVMGPVAVLSWLPSFQSMQTRILFNHAFSRGLQVSKLLSGKKTTYRGNY